MVMRVPYTAGEKESLSASLERHRQAVLWKLDGLDDEQLRRAVTPSGNSILGLVKHLGYVEDVWFCETFGRPTISPEHDPEDPDADLRVEPDETTADVLDYYARARANSDALVAELGVEATGTAWYGPTVTMRWVLIHMIEETARHAGHVDVMRELIDGRKGDHPDE
ncbi:DinB family protein [Actinomycetes bacterium KLBMP 9759]